MSNEYDNHDRIWLEPSEDAIASVGRQWCQDNQWGKAGVEYVRADLNLSDIAALSDGWIKAKGELAAVEDALVDKAKWIKTCTAKISNAIGGGSELFTRHGEEFRLDVDFVCQRIREMRERYHDAMFRAIKTERQPPPPSTEENTPKDSKHSEALASPSTENMER